MNFLKTLLGKKQTEIKNSQDFWQWFITKERTFQAAVKEQNNIEALFFNELSPKLSQLREGLFFLTGMKNNDTVELVITADGNIKNIAFVEDLVAAAPQISGWEFTSLKPALNINDVYISMHGYDFKDSNLSFYSNDDDAYPDEVSITVVYDDFKPEDKDLITNGVYIFLDNFLGELRFATMVDNLCVESKADAEKELISIEKLPSYLIWREKEFVEKYEAIKYNTDNDSCSGFKAQTANGLPIIGLINIDVLKWDNKPSYSWLLNIQLKYDGRATNGMPDDKMYALLDTIEDELSATLTNSGNTLNIGRETGDNVRVIYYACKDFRAAGKITEQVIGNYANKVDFDYTIYKDKYWKSLSHYVAM